ncbi:MAG: hypothetical protein P1V36_04770, partial [Planctomycetota bacterium]|nr:hypothetical protein [Planctomycetota bacterium]
MGPVSAVERQEVGRIGVVVGGREVGALVRLRQVGAPAHDEVHREEGRVAERIHVAQRRREFAAIHDARAAVQAHHVLEADVAVAVGHAATGDAGTDAGLLAPESANDARMHAVVHGAREGVRDAVRRAFEVRVHGASEARGKPPAGLAGPQAVLGLESGQAPAGLLDVRGGEGACLQALAQRDAGRQPPHDDAVLDH